MTTTPEKIQMVVDYSGASHDDAKAMLVKQSGDVISALVELAVTPAISGTKYIPPTPKIDDGHDDETRERIRQGRLMAEMLNASPRNDLRGKATHYPPRLASVPEGTPPAAALP